MEKSRRRAFALKVLTAFRYRVPGVCPGSLRSEAKSLKIKNSETSRGDGILL